MASIKFYVNKSKEKWGEEETLYAKFSHCYSKGDYQSVKIFPNEPLKVDPTKWNVKTQKLKGTSSAAMKVQQRINAEERRIAEAWAELMSSQPGDTPPTLSELKAKLSGSVPAIGTYSCKTLYDLIQLYVEEKRMSYSKNTIIFYREALWGNLKEFEAATKQNMKIECIDLTFFTRFKSFNVGIGNKNQSTNVYISNILAVIRWHYENGAELIRNRINLDFMRVKKLPTSAKGERDHVSEQEAMFLYGLQLTGIKGKARDIYLFMVFTGPRFGDTLNSLRLETNIRHMPVGDEMIKVLCYTQQKVKGEEEVVVPLNQLTQLLIERNSEGDTGPLFPRMPKNTFRYALYSIFSSLRDLYLFMEEHREAFVAGEAKPRKTVRDALQWLGVSGSADINKLDAALKTVEGFMRKREDINYVGNERVTHTYERWEKLSAHTGRHSFGSLLADKGASVKEAQKMLGHRNSKTTEKYYHIDKEKTVQKVSAMLAVPLMKVG